MRSKRSRLSDKQLRVNQFLELVVFDPDQGKLNLYSRVLDINDGKLTISWPVDSHNSRYFFQKVDYAVVQCLVGGEAISFKVQIKAEDIENHEAGKLVLGLPVFVEEVDQKRIYTRIKYQVPVKYKIQEKLGFSQASYEGLTVDLSIGGMELASFEDLEEGVEIECFFTLHFMDFRGVQGKVIRKRETTENGNLEYLYAIQFLGMLERERIALNQILMTHHPFAEPKVLLNRATTG